MNKHAITLTQIILDVLGILVFLVDALLDKKVHPVIALIWVTIALFAHIEAYRQEEL